MYKFNLDNYINEYDYDLCGNHTESDNDESEDEGKDFNEVMSKDQESDGQNNKEGFP